MKKISLLKKLKNNLNKLYGDSNVAFILLTEGLMKVITPNQNIIIELSIDEIKKLYEIVGNVCLNKISEDEYLFSVNLREKLRKVIYGSV